MSALLESGVTLNRGHQRWIFSKLKHERSISTVIVVVRFIYQFSGPLSIKRDRSSIQFEDGRGFFLRILHRWKPIQLATIIGQQFLVHGRSSLYSVGQALL